jgi:protein SCO1/2
MSHNFHQIDDALLKNPASAQKTHLLSISFDPAFDVPSVLEKYGRTYT